MNGQIISVSRSVGNCQIGFHKVAIQFSKRLVHVLDLKLQYYVDINLEETSKSVIDEVQVPGYHSCADVTYLKQQLILRDPLHGFEEVRTERQLVAEALLTSLQKQVCVHQRLPQPLRARNVLAVIAV